MNDKKEKNSQYCSKSHSVHSILFKTNKLVLLVIIACLSITFAGFSTTYSLNSQDNINPIATVDLNAGETFARFNLGDGSVLIIPSFKHNVILRTIIDFIDCDSIETLSINLSVDGLEYQEVYQGIDGQINLRSFEGKQEFIFLLDDSGYFAEKSNADEIDSFLDIPVTISVSGNDPRGVMQVLTCELETFDSQILQNSGHSELVRIAQSRFAFFSISKGSVKRVRIQTCAFLETTGYESRLTIRDETHSSKSVVNSITTIRIGDFSSSETVSGTNPVTFELNQEIGIKSITIEKEYIFLASFEEFDFVVDLVVEGEIITDPIIENNPVYDFTPDAFLISSLVTLGIPAQLYVRKKIGKTS